MPWVKIVIILCLILVNGFFSLAEMAIVSARKARLQQAANAGNEGARVALELKQDAGRFLSTVQIGITAINVLASVLGGATLADTIDHWLVYEGGWAARNATAISFVVVVLAISYLTLIFGELVLKLIPLRTDETQAVTGEEIAIMLREGAALGHFERTETAIVQMALRLDDRPVNAVMTPRTQAETLDLGDSDDENRRKIAGSAYSRFPVVDGSPPQVHGIVEGKQLLAAALKGQPFDLRAVVRPPLYVPASVTALRALEIFKASG